MKYVTFDFLKLAKLILNDFSFEEFAEELGICIFRLQNIFLGIDFFTIEEMLKMSRILRIPIKNLNDYFFKLKILEK